MDGIPRVCIPTLFRTAIKTRLEIILILEEKSKQ